MKPTNISLNYSLLVGIYCSYFDFKLNLPNYVNMLFDQKYSKFVDNLLGMNQNIQRINIIIAYRIKTRYCNYTVVTS